MPKGDGRPARRTRPAKRLPGGAADVSRLELENLYTEVAGLIKGLKRVDTDLQRLAERVHRLERRLGRADR